MFETLRTLIRPFFGFFGLVLSKNFGIRPMLSLAAVLALQIAVVLHFFAHLSLAGTITVAGLAIVFHMVAIFFLLAVAYGVMDQSYKDAKKQQGKSDKEAERDAWNAYLIAGYLWTVIPASVTVGITFWFASASLSSFFLALLFSVYVGGIIDVLGVGLPLYRLIKSKI